MPLRVIRAQFGPFKKYCARGDLESQKVETTYGERYLVTPGLGRPSHLHDH
jgi:hypothetical protein